MKTFTLIFTGLVTIGLLSFALPARSTVWIVQTIDFEFVPSELSVQMGDTIRWIWVEGVHTTTSSSVPAGAITWDSPLTASVTSFDYVAATAGIYTYVCTPHAAFGMVGSFNVQGFSWIPGEVASPALQVYPNPFTDHVKVTFSEDSPVPRELSIFDAAGRTFRYISFPGKQATRATEIPLADLPKGLYLLRFQDDSGKPHVVRLVKN